MRQYGIPKTIIGQIILDEVKNDFNKEIGNNKNNDDDDFIFCVNNLKFSNIYLLKILIGRK